MYKNPIKMIFLPRKLKQGRINKNLSQKQLADLVGISRQEISNIERGIHNPALDTLIMMCFILDLDIKTLLYLDYELIRAVATTRLYLGTLTDFLKFIKDKSIKLMEDK